MITTNALACAECGAPTRVRCANCQKLFCLDHLTKVYGAGNSINSFCTPCLEMYQSNPACYGTMRLAGPWTDGDRAQMQGS